MSELSIQETKLSKHLTLRTVPMDAAKQACQQTTYNRPLVLFFPWLKAPRKVINRYCQLYHDVGWDVLAVDGEAKHFL